MTDPIADLLTRIRNAYAAKHDTVSIPHSNQKEAIAKVLAAHGYVEGVEVVADKAIKSLTVTLKYVGNSPAISTIDRISTPGRRVYSAAKDIKRVLAGNGIRIISTNKGIMTDAEAKSQKLGGEVICKVW